MLACCPGGGLRDTAAHGMAWKRLGLGGGGSEPGDMGLMRVYVTVVDWLRRAQRRRA